MNNNITMNNNNTMNNNTMNNNNTANNSKCYNYLETVHTIQSMDRYTLQIYALMTESSDWATINILLVMVQ